MPLIDPVYDPTSPATLALIKQFMRVQNTVATTPPSSVDDPLIAQMMVSADSLIVGYLGVPIQVTHFTFTDDGLNERNYIPPMSLVVPKFPVVPKQDIYPGTAGVVSAPTITDVDGTVIDPTVYLLTPLDGVFRSLPGAISPTGQPFFFDNPPYVVDYWAGLQAHPEYMSRMDNLLVSVLWDVVSLDYGTRALGIKQASYGGGAYTTFDTTTGLPARIVAKLAPLRNFMGVAA